MGFESIVSDIDLALVFAEIAAVSDSRDTRTCNLANACDTYLQLRNEARIYSANDWQRVEIEARLGKLRGCLGAFGRNVCMTRLESGCYQNLS